MSAKVQETLTAYGALGVELLQNAVPKATGKTAQSIRYVVYPNRLVILARAFFETLETGRGPRKDSTYSGFDKSLLDWMAARGIGSELDEKKKKQLARFLSYKINKEGDKTFRQGGKTVYSQILAKFVDELKKEIIAIKNKEYSDFMVKEFKIAVHGSFSN